jgi:hypothetical protein
MIVKGGLSMMVKGGAGLLAGVLAGGLGFAFWPRVEPGVLSLRPAVEKPVFVVATEPARPVSPPSTNLVPAPATPAGDKNGLVKLAAALRSDPTAPPSATAPSATPLGRGLTTAALKMAAPSDQAARFFALGLVALADGDVAGARAFLDRAADEGDTRALMVLGDTYDQATLTRLGAVGIRGDASRARDYYARALAAGVVAARQRIAALGAKGN